MTDVKLPLKVRVPAYLLNLLLSGLGSAVIAFLLAENWIDKATAALLVVVIGVIGSVSASLSLSHLSLSDSAESDAVTLPATVEPEPANEDAGAVGAQRVSLSTDDLGTADYVDQPTDTPNPAARADAAKRAARPSRAKKS